MNQVTYDMTNQKMKRMAGVVVYTFNPVTPDTSDYLGVQGQTSGLIQVPSQPNVHGEALSFLSFVGRGK